ncbi:MAG: hypothetical protein JRD89_00865 [Deltaproteobacteria bacterium]|nr:hypothetical protein [Deltaproteobacteria bacterium]
MPSGLTSLLRAVSGPLIVWPGQENSLPENLKSWVILDRLANEYQNEKNGEELASEGEALLYLFTASLVQPFDRDWFEIYSYLFQKYCKARQIDIPSGINPPETLNQYQQSLLDNLRRWIHRQSMNAMPKTRRARKQPEVKKGQCSILDFS